MNKFVLVILFVIFWSASLFGQSPFSAYIDSLILSGMDLTINSQFDSAMSTFQRVVDFYPDHAVGYFYQAATLQSKMMDYETNLWEGHFFKLINKTIEIGINKVENGDDDPWISFYLGSAHSYKGLYQAKNGGLIKGFISARKGIHHLKRAIEQDSSIYDAYLGLGSYMYWAGKYYKYLRWLPWIRDERDLGVSLVKKAVAKSTFSHWVGVNNLGWIEYDRGSYQSALQLFQYGLNHYPASRFFLWGFASATFSLEQYCDAIDVYNKLLESVRKEEINNGYNEAECHLKLLLAYYQLEDYHQCLFHCHSILNLDTEIKVMERLSEHIDQAEDYKKKCLNKLKER